MKQLIINCDDYGPNPNVNETAIKAFNQGLISSVSVIPTINDITEAMNLLKQCKNIGIGVHLTFTSGRPLLPINKAQSLVEKNGSFTSAKTYFEKKNKTIDASELYNEFDLQIKKLLSYNLTITHLDNHNPCIYLFPNLFEVVIDLAKKYNLPIRNPFGKNYKEDAGILSKIIQRPFDEYLILADKITKTILDSKIVTNDYFIAEFTFSDHSVKNLIKELKSLKDGTTEICVHLNNEGTGLAEYQTLSDPLVLKNIKDNNIIFSHYGNIGK